VELQTEHKPERDAEDHAEEEAVRDGAGDRAQRATPATEQVVGEVEAAQQVEHDARKGDGC
jgi:hypothetical protein